jgi:hypothetical protein
MKRTIVLLLLLLPAIAAAERLADVMDNLDGSRTEQTQAID